MKKNNFVPYNLDNFKMTYKNQSTGEISEQEFSFCYDIHEEFGVVSLLHKPFEAGKMTYFNPSTGKLCKHTFESCTDISEGFGSVKIRLFEETYFNPNTDKLCNRTFASCGQISDGYGAVQLDASKWTYFNPSTEEFCKQTFKCCHKLCGGVGTVELSDGQYTYFNPKTGEISDELRSPSDTEKMLRENPLSFEFLPTSAFTDKDLICKYIDVIVDQLQKDCPDDAAKDYIAFTTSLNNVMERKIKREEAVISKEYNKISQSSIEEKEPKVTSVQENIKSISKLGKELL